LVDTRRPQRIGQLWRGWVQLRWGGGVEKNQGGNWGCTDEGKREKAMNSKSGGR